MKMERKFPEHEMKMENLLHAQTENFLKEINQLAACWTELDHWH